jgi:transposase-like protein
VLDELLPVGLHVLDQYANNVIRSRSQQTEVRLRPMRGLKRFRSAQVISAGHAFVQNPNSGAETEKEPDDMGS